MNGETFYLDSGLHKVQLHSQRLSHKHVGVVAVEEGALQLLQLPASEVRSRSASLAASAIFGLSLRAVAA